MELYILKVLNVYINGLRNIKRYFNSKQLSYYKNGYNYNCDNIDVTLIERQNIIPNQINGLKKDYIRYKKIMDKTILKDNFIPDKVLVHMPSTSRFIIENIEFTNDKYAVLHYTDIKYYNQKGNDFINYLNNNYKKVYCRSKAIYNFFKDKGIKVLDDSIIYSGVDIKDSINKDFNHDKLNILYVGKLIKRKKLDLLIKSLSNIDHNKWNLTAIGNGSFKKECIELTNQLSLNNNISFLDAMPKENVFDYMKKADIFCMPSINETLGLVYLEAMALGCITIGTNNEGIDGIIVNGINGYLTEPNEIYLTKLLESIINSDIKIKEQISQNAIKTGLEYNEEKQSKKYLDLIMGD